MTTGTPHRGILVAMAAAVLGSALLGGCAGTKAKRESAGLAPKDSSPADLYVNMASAYYQRGQYDAALERALRAVNEDKRNPDAHYVLGIIYQRLGKQAAADKHLAEALRLDPDDPELLNARGTVLCSDGSHTQAIALFEKAATNPLYSTPEVPLMNASDCSRRAGRTTDAERYLRESLTKNANYPPALLAMAQLNYDRGETKPAREYIARYGRFGRATPPALLLAYRIETKLGNKTSAKALADALRTRYPDAPQIMEL
jgi:type IV pilus assembly protein PilF